MTPRRGRRDRDERDGMVEHLGTVRTYRIEVQKEVSYLKQLAPLPKIIYDLSI